MHSYLNVVSGGIEIKWQSNIGHKNGIIALSHISEWKIESFLQLEKSPCTKLFSKNPQFIWKNSLKIHLYA